MKKQLSLLLLLIATMTSWTSVFAQSDEEYNAALNSIEDNAAYYIKVDWGNSTEYLTREGKLTEFKKQAGVFKFRKTSGGAAYGYGYRIDSGGLRFTNPPGNTNTYLSCGYINTTTDDRYDWDTQVLFLNSNGKYAVRATNAKSGNESGSWSYVAGTFWTVDGGNAEYSRTPQYIWQLEKKYTAEEVEQLEQATVTMQSWIPTIQTDAGLVKNASQYTSNAKDPEEGSYEALLDGKYETFFHSTWHNYTNGDHYLQATLTEPVQKFEFYYKKRSQNNNNRPTIIIISASNDGSNFIVTQVIDSGLPVDESVIDYISDVIDLGASYKYVRFTVTDTNNGDMGMGDHVFFTFSEFYMLPNTTLVTNALDMLKSGTPLYALDLSKFNSINQSLGQISGVVTVTYKLVEADGTVVSTKYVVQEPYSNVDVPAELTSIDYYDYEVTGTIGDTNCEIIVKRTYKQGLVLALSDLKNDKAYIITCERGKFLTKDGFLASTAHSSLTNASPSTFAIISSGDKYYLYSVADGKFVTNNGVLADNPTHGVKDAIIMEAQTVPYFLYRFNKDDAYLNTNGDNPYGYVINSWSTPDPGNQYYMIAVEDFDPTNALAVLNQTTEVYFDVVYNGEIIKTATAAATVGGFIPALPAELDNGLINLSQPSGIVTKANQHFQIIATSKTPFEFTTDFNNPKWYNMTIRGNWFLYYDVWAYPYYYPKEDVSDIDKVKDAYQWAFGGNPYSIVVYNRASDFYSSLAKTYDNEVYMDYGTYKWDALACKDGIILKEPGSEHNCINQYGGGGGPLLLWDDVHALTDEGCILRILPVPLVASHILTVGETGYATLCLQFPSEPRIVPGKSITAYTGKITMQDDYTYLALTALPTNTIPAFLPVVIKATPGDYEFYLTDDPSPEVYEELRLNDDLSGTIDELDAAGRYILDKHGNDPVGFYKASTGKIAPNSAFLECGINLYAFFFSKDDAVGIEAIDNGQLTTDDEIYNLSGQRLSKIQKGINIVGGKKKLMK